MSVRGWTPLKVLSPRGAWPDIALTSESIAARAAVAQNLRITTGPVGFCQTRPGTSAVLETSGKVTGMYNWISPTDNFVIYQDGTAIKRVKLSDNSVVTLLSSIGATRAPSVADLDTFLFFTGYDTSSNGSIQAHVWGGAATPDVDVCFRRPLQISAFTAVDGGVGQCTIGTHLIGFLYQTRNGYIGQPGPFNGGGVFTPTSVTLNAGLRTINVTITLDTPVDGGGTANIIPIMTRADNPAAFFLVPSSAISGSLLVPASSIAHVITFSISITDEDLAGATPADNYFNALIQDVSGNGPFNPSFVVAYGQRMCYGSGVSLFISNIGNPQFITEDLNRIFLPNQRKIGYAFQMGQNLFVTGDKWTGRTSDNGNDPSTWPQPTLISDAIGAPSPNCVEKSTVGNYAWVASETGVFVFDGNYPQRPITYLSSVFWKRVNWAASYCIQIKDNATEQRCYVAVPIDGALDPTHILVIDYSSGMSYDTCDITTDIFAFGVFSSLGCVKEVSTNRTAVWIGPYGFGGGLIGHIVHYDSAVYSDYGGLAINCIWQSGLIRRPGDADSITVRVGNVHNWIRGSGTLHQAWRGLDNSPVVVPAVLTLSPTMGQIPLSKINLNPVENFTVQLQTAAVSDWFQSSGLIAYIRPSLYNR